MPLFAQNAVVDPILLAQRTGRVAATTAVLQIHRRYRADQGGHLWNQRTAFDLAEAGRREAVLPVRSRRGHVDHQCRTVHVERHQADPGGKLAYYAQVPWNGQGNGNPASFYCTQPLGGAEIGATAFAGGAWVSKTGEIQQLEACVFPDESIIDSWGLLDHANNIIRGIDLSTVLVYKNPY